MPDTWYTFAAGQFNVSGPPPGFDAAAGDLAAEMIRLGYCPAAAAGDLHDVNYDLFERPEGGWAAIVRLAGRRCDDWPELLGLLAVLSPIVLAGCVRRADAVGSRADGDDRGGAGRHPVTSCKAG
jgi:hypothetical protein